MYRQTCPCPLISRIVLALIFALVPRSVATPPACMLSCISAVARGMGLDCPRRVSELCQNREAIIGCLKDVCPHDNFDAAQDYFQGTCLDYLEIVPQKIAHNGIHKGSMRWAVEKLDSDDSLLLLAHTSLSSGQGHTTNNQMDSYREPPINQMENDRKLPAIKSYHYRAHAASDIAPINKPQNVAEAKQHPTLTSLRTPHHRTPSGNYKMSGPRVFRMDVED